MFGQTAIQSFQNKHIPEPMSGCWLWFGATNSTGYGYLRDGYRQIPAHRFSYEFHKGPIPKGLHIDHKCRNPACVNPDHLEPVTPAENVRRGRNGVLKTHCKQGHPFTGDNILHWRGLRMCRACRAAKWLKTPARQRRLAAARRRQTCSTA